MRAKKRRHYHVSEMPDANRLARIAQDAIEAARERAPDQREKADRLFRAIYGPGLGQPVKSRITDKSTHPINSLGTP